MTGIFGIDLAGIIFDELGPLLLDATLIKVTPGTRTGGSLTGGTNPNEASHSTKGFIDNYSDEQINGTVVMLGDRKITLLGDGLPSGVVPTPGDKITIESQTFVIADPVNRDPAAATYECNARLN